MILSIDQGTTGSTALLFDKDGQVRSRAYSEFSQIYPQPAWVEHDPMEIWQVTLDVMRQAIAEAGVDPSQIASIGLTNQRETTVLWNKETGEPVHNAIVWQCRRSADICENIKADNRSDWIKGKTGLVVDAYFSATKIRWIFENNPDIAEQAKQGKIAFGTIDSWLLWQLTGGQSHGTDHTNASRTMLYNIHTQSWDEELLEYFDIPESILPTINHSASLHGQTTSNLIGEQSIPIHGIAGDQQAALFGQQCVNPGQAKNTYGTGCFMLMNTGNKAVSSPGGLLTTMACDPQGKPAYALEGAVFMAGAAVQWLRDEMELIEKASQTEAIAASLQDTQGVYVVPAFTGLGAPHWDMKARGAISGLTRGTGKRHIVRATLEAIAYQARDVLDLMVQESGVPIESLKVDGGACANNFLMQFQADMLARPVHRPNMVDSTALGAAILAGIGCRLWDSQHLPAGLGTIERSFRPAMSQEQRERCYQGWLKAVGKVRSNN